MSAKRSGPDKEERQSFQNHIAVPSTKTTEYTDRSDSEDYNIYFEFHLSLKLFHRDFEGQSYVKHCAGHLDKDEKAACAG